MTQRFMILFWVLIVSCGAISKAFASPSLKDASTANGKYNSEQFHIACSPEKPVVHPGESIQVNVWAGSLNGTPLNQKATYVWAVTAGQIVESNAGTYWTFKGAKKGTHTATIKGTIRQLGTTTCSIDVVMVEVPKPSSARGPASLKSFLLPKQREMEHLGLYSYLLLYARPGSDDLERYVAIIQSYLELLPALTEQWSHIYQSQINITYLPVTEPPPSDAMLPRDSEKVARWVVDHYDYRRAQELLGKLSGNYQDGPYFYSANAPLSSKQSVPEHLWLEVPRMPPHLARRWVKEFLNQAAQERYWEKRGLNTLYLNVRLTIGILSIALPDVLKSIDAVVKIASR